MGFKKILSGALLVTLLMGNGICACAAPESYNGIMFDAEYYAISNPDVVAVIGNDKNALFEHYINFGQNEGRLGLNPATSASMYTREVKPSASALAKLNDLGVLGVDYIITSGDRRYRYGYFDKEAWEASGGQKDVQLFTRQDFPDGFIDMDGNGIDDRDPGNAYGVDLNLDGIDDRSTHTDSFTHITTQNINADLRGMYKICEHGIVVDMHYISLGTLCPACNAAEIARLEYNRSISAARSSGTVSVESGYKKGDTVTVPFNDGMLTLVYTGDGDKWYDAVRDWYWTAKWGGPADNLKSRVVWDSGWISGSKQI